MAVAILHLHRDTAVANTAVVVPEELVMEKDVGVSVPAEGLSAMCAPPGVVFAPEQ